MSSSDRQEQGPLTRKQLREIRLTGSTPVISAEDAAAAVAPPVPPLPEVPVAEQSRPAAEQNEPAAEPAKQAASAAAGEAGRDAGSAPLTRRQVRAQERGRTGSVPVADTDVADAHTDSTDEVEVLVQVDESEIVSGVPGTAQTADAVIDDDDDDAVDDVEIVVPVSAADAARPADGDDDAADLSDLGIEREADPDDVLADPGDDDDLEDGERPTVNPAFGVGVMQDADTQPKPFAPSFDELLTVGDSTGSQHLAPSALIFTPSPGEGSLSGPVASTGEILVTGSYELPRGMGSQGHALGTTDGREADAVLIDGELAPASSPTPIAASSAVSTIKPAGEVIRPPAPEKGNKLTLILTIAVGGLALALAVVLVVAFTTNVF